jgi:hypothetical protein
MFRLSSVSIYLLIGFALAGISCKKSNYTYQYQKDSTKNTVESQIAFLTFLAIDRADSSAFIELTNQKRVEGTFKDQPIASKSPNRLEIKLLTDNKQELSSYEVSHPLLKEVEYSDSNNQLISKVVKLKKEEFFVRVTLPSNVVLVRIDEIKDNKLIGNTFFKLK